MRELVVVVAGRLLQIAIGLIALRLMTWKLDQVEMGRYALITTIISMFALALINPLGMYFYRHIHEWIKVGHGRVFLVAICLLVVLVALASVPMISLISALGVDLNLPWIQLLVPGSLLFVSLNNTLVPAINILGYRGRWLVLSVATLALSLLLSALLVWNSPSAELWLVGQLTGHGLLLILALVWFFHFLGREVNETDLMTQLGAMWEQQRTAFLVFVFPLSIAVTLSWVQFQAFRIFLGELSSLETLGTFAAAYAVSAGVMASIESVAQQYFYPKFYNDISSANREICVESWRRYASVLFPIVTLFFFFILGFAKPLLVLLVDSKYHDAVFFVYVAACIEYCRILGNIYNVFMQATKETHQLVKPQLLGCVVALIVVPAGIYFAGELGFSAAVVASSLLYVILIRLVVHRSSKSRINLRGLHLIVIFGGVCTVSALILSTITPSFLLSLVIISGAGGGVMMVLYRIIVHRSNEFELYN